MKSILLGAALLFSAQVYAGQGYLVKFKNNRSLRAFQGQMAHRTAMKDLKLANWVKVDLNDSQLAMLKNHPDVLAVEKNRTLKVQTHFKFDETRNA